MVPFEITKFKSSCIEHKHQSYVLCFAICLKHEMIASNVLCITGPSPSVIISSTYHHHEWAIATMWVECKHQHQQYCSKWVIIHRNLCCNNAILSKCACVFMFFHPVNLWTWKIWKQRLQNTQRQSTLCMRM